MTITSAYHRVRIGVIGLGRFGRVHVLTTAGVIEANLVGVVDSDEQRLARVVREHNGVRGWSDLDRALDESDAEAWIVATSTDSHVAITRKLLTAGKKVLLEKPIAGDFEHAESLSPLVKADSSNLMLGHVALFNSEFQQLVREARQRAPIAFIDCVRHRPVTTLERFPGETPFQLTMVHDLYMALVLMNRAEPTRFSAQMHKTSDGRCDLALAQLQFANGAIASFTASFMTPAGMAADGFDRIEVFGEGWAARIHPNPRPIEIWGDAAQWPMGLEIQAEPGSQRGMLAEQLRCFCRVVRGTEPVPVGATYQDALQIMRWINQL